MECPALSLPRLARPGKLLADPLYEPPLVIDGHVIRLTPREPAVVHQEEGGFEDQGLLILRLKAKET